MEAGWSYLGTSVFLTPPFPPLHIHRSVLDSETLLWKCSLSFFRGKAGTGQFCSQTFYLSENSSSPIPLKWTLGREGTVEKPQRLKVVRHTLVALFPHSSTKGEVSPISSFRREDSNQKVVCKDFTCGPHLLKMKLSRIACHCLSLVLLWHLYLKGNGIPEVGLQHKEKFGEKPIYCSQNHSKPFNAYIHT